MKVKKFVAPSMPEAMKQIRKELGVEAVILNSREIYKKGGAFGLFKKKYIEVVAAVDGPSQKPSIMKTATPLKKGTDSGKLLEEKGNLGGDGELAKELQDLKHLLFKLTENTAKYGREGEIIPESVPKPFQPVLKNLHKQEVSATIIHEMLPGINEAYYKDPSRFNEMAAKNWIREELHEKLKGLSFGSPADKKYIQLLGPTGVGKTTTLAKIAALYSQKGEKLAFITTDTYRIGAVEQLKTYANILRVPIEVCYTKTDYVRAIDRFSHYDHVFIDTAGRNYRDEKYVSELADLIDFNQDMETLLVFSLTAKEADLDAIYRQFASKKIDRFIFTKFDETIRYGALINLPMKYKKGIAFITTGQEVPDDIQVGDPDWILDQLLEEPFDA